MIRPEPNQVRALVAEDLAALLRRCADSEQAALREIYDRLGPKLYGIALRILREPAEASDAVQDGFLQIWENARHFDPFRGDPAAWINGIIRYRALDIVRRRGREVFGHTPVVEPDSGPDALAQLEGSADANALRRCMALLDAAHQRLLILAYGHGMTHAELAAHTGHPLGTVKSWVRRSLIRLRECLST